MGKVSKDLTSSVVPPVKLCVGMAGKAVCGGTPGPGSPPAIL